MCQGLVPPKLLDDVAEREGTLPHGILLKRFKKVTVFMVLSRGVTNYELLVDLVELGNVFCFQRYSN